MESRPSYRDKYSFVIPAAGLGRRMKTYGPKSLIQIDDYETILSRQIRHIQDSFKRFEIILVGGYQIEKLQKSIPKNVKLVYNNDYENSNVARSIKIGLEHVKTEKVIFIYGDLIFNQECINLPFHKESSVVICDNMKKEEVGCIINDSKLQNVFYQLPNKWAQISFFTGKELQLLKETLKNQATDVWFGFEIINQIINYGGQFQALTPENGNALDIDSSLDLKLYYENFN
jgi:choline kinase